MPELVSRRSNLADSLAARNVCFSARCVAATVQQQRPCSSPSVPRVVPGGIQKGPDGSATALLHRRQPGHQRPAAAFRLERVEADGPDRQLRLMVLRRGISGPWPLLTRF